MSKRMTCFLYSLVFALGASNNIESLWIVILFYALRSLNQKSQERIIIVGGLASLGAIMKSIRAMAIELETANLAYPLKPLLDFIAYKYAYSYIIATLSVVFIIISIVFVIVGCVSKN